MKQENSEIGKKVLTDGLDPCQQTFENKKFVDMTQQCCALSFQINFPANNLNFY